MVRLGHCECGWKPVDGALGGETMVEHQALCGVHRALMSGNPPDSDDFERTNTSDLGDNWTIYAEGSGPIRESEWLGTDYKREAISLVLRNETKADPMPLVFMSNGNRIQFDPVCPGCGKEWKKDDEARSVQGGPFMHVACSERVSPAIRPGRHNGVDQIRQFRNLSD
jgi:hypothetical protein